MKILISGCACSGTVLLTRLMFSFKEIQDSIKGTRYRMQMRTEPMCRIGHGVCIKGSNKQLFSADLPEEEIQAQYKWLRWTDVKVAFIVRYPPDVFSSAKTAAIFKELKDLWLVVAKQWEKYSELIDTTVKFEDVVLEPDKTQQKIARDLNLTIEHPFSNYPRFMKPGWLHNHKKTHAARPLDTSRIGKPRGYGLKKGKAWIECYRPHERKQVERYLDMFGYEVN